MGFLIRVVKGNYDNALRQFNRLSQSDNLNKLMMNRRFNEKPCQKRRRIQAQGIKRAEKASLYHNLRVIFSRKARGF